MNDIAPLDDSRLFAPPPPQESRTDLGQQDFLTLMITQFRNQDPFKPMENGEFLGQLAQFSTVSGISSLNEGFNGLSASLVNDQALQAANLVGRRVLASADVGYLADGGSISGAVQLGSSASSVQVEIADSSGELIRRIDLGAQPSGQVRFTWDGRDSRGDVVDSGDYSIVTRVSRGANVENAETLLEATIESVSLGRFGQGITLNLPGGAQLPLSQIRQIT
ncbi:MAG: flagellar hook assembly protein FlgD [Gammaproteobacteria bacterium]|nr:flagellar hook assembly protein FlgD [Gammaproteobacteria bacterium]